MKKIALGTVVKYRQGNNPQSKAGLVLAQSDDSLLIAPLVYKKAVENTEEGYPYGDRIATFRSSKLIKQDQVFSERERWPMEEIINFIKANEKFIKKNRELTPGDFVWVTCSDKNKFFRMPVLVSDVDFERGEFTFISLRRNHITLKSGTETPYPRGLRKASISAASTKFNPKKPLTISELREVKKLVDLRKVFGDNLTKHFHLLKTNKIQTPPVEKPLGQTEGFEIKPGDLFVYRTGNRRKKAVAILVKGEMVYSANYTQTGPEDYDNPNRLPVGEILVDLKHRELTSIHRIEEITESLTFEQVGEIMEERLNFLEDKNTLIENSKVVFLKPANGSFIEKNAMVLEVDFESGTVLLLESAPRGATTPDGTGVKHFTDLEAIMRPLGSRETNRNNPALTADATRDKTRIVNSELLKTFEKYREQYFQD